MKNRVLPLIWVGLLLPLFFSCEPDDSVSVAVDEVVTSGNWKVVYYFDDKDETYKFNGYSFVFSTDGKLTATFSGQTKTGVWSVNSSSNKFIMTISGTDALDDMTDDWLIVEKTDTFIKLKDDNLTKKEEIHLQRN